MIPVLDWSAFQTDPQAFSAELGQICRKSGFFLLKNHDVPKALIDACFGQADAFFALPEAQKAKLSIASNPHNRGWAAMGSESLDEASGQIDQKQAFNIGLDLAADDPAVLRGDAFRGVNLWPAIDGFRDIVLDYFNAVWKQGIDLHAAFARDLGLDPDYFAPHFDAPMATLRLLSYPSASGQKNEMGAGAHTDYGSITLLMTDGVSGLQVKPRGGDWVDVPHAPNAFVVNIGDCLMRWTNEIYASTPHRVLPPPKARRSIAFFLDPNPDSLIAALPGTGAAKFPPVLAKDYLRARLDATYHGKDQDETA
ncbi:2-oxoglutarate and iron-dependent oxygenase domain-containing protein [Yoonia sp. BS5-3]|uniref:2-oxoglutarate-dependent ethylene/succinate-forming enzyme n=1 Tax=Yoonia phaeophyticola TaxID=3137369 RepID=A0ABZ2V3J7_9RHOB